MTAKIIEFPGNTNQSLTDDGEENSDPSPLKPSMEIDRQLDRDIRTLDKDDPIRKDLLNGTNSIAFSNVFQMLKKKPEELRVFCNTLAETDGPGVPWGDVYCLTDRETYRYIFTLFTVSYVRECQMRRGEVIEASAENIILPVPGLTFEHLTQGVEKWVNEYYPGLTGVPVQQEDPKVVREMILESMEEDPP